MKFYITIFGFLFVNILSAQKQLENIEQKIFTAYSESIQSKTDQLQSVYETLKTLDNQDNKVSYWMAFAKYQQARYTNRTDNGKAAFKYLKEGIEILKSIKKPSSEDLVLHGTLMSFSMVFQRNLAAVISGKTNALLDKALKANKNNLRVYLAIGRSDYFKPAQYGGGFKVESYLKQALTKPDKTSENSFAPTWGREQVYYFLVSFLARENRIEEAKLYYHQGLKKFPDSYKLKSLKSKFNGE
ncbi:MAG: hypothetical protein V3U92_13065 [Cellulophaga sp.]